MFQKLLIVKFYFLFISIIFCSVAQAIELFEDFNSPLVLSVSSADNAWYPDRKAPAIFESFLLDNGETVLLLGIARNDFVKYNVGDPNYDFLNTQGRKFNLNNNFVTCIEGDVYIPEDWSTVENKRRTDIWATTVDVNKAIATYPIIGYVNDGSFFTGFRFFTQDRGWVNFYNVDIMYNDFNNLRIMFTKTDYTVYINDKLVYTDYVVANSVKVINIMIQGKNFGQDYNIYWDNIAAGVCTPTAILLSSFDAIPGNNSVTLKWETGDETDNFGFNIYRADSSDGEYVKISESFIPSEVGSGLGTNYEFTDSDVKNRKTYFYKLEDIDVNGIATMHGPVKAMPRLIYGAGK